jgi:putative sterol carrier protein
MFMTDPTTAFFQGLTLRGREPAFADLTATVRFDVARDSGTRSWLLAIDHGEVGVSQTDRDADCVISTNEELFRALTRGEANTMAAVLRGEVAVTGDPELVVAVQRLFPGPSVRTGGTQRPAGGQSA